MRIRPLSLLTAVLVAILLLVGTAGPAWSKLSSERATKLTENWAAKKCAKIDDCVRSAGRYCYPLSENKRRCTAQVIRRLEDGDLIQCQTMLFWVLDPGTKAVELVKVDGKGCD